jgi:hypothetical protein
LYGLSRTTVGRHRKHVYPTSRKFAVIESPDGPSGQADPLAEAFALAERARTAREQLRALEQVRAATKLFLRGNTDLDSEDRHLLSTNIASAEKAYRDAEDFETRARALSGWREALHQRIDATGVAEPIEVPIALVFADGTSAQPAWLGNVDTEPVMWLSAETYWRGVPQRFRDRSRFAISRTITLTLEGRDPAPDEIRIHNSNGLLLWANV